MENQKIAYLLDNASNQHLEEKIGLKQMMTQEEGILLVVILNLKLQC